MNDIIVSDVSYQVKDKIILNNISFTVTKGESFALLGENGSGKSTLIDVILNDLKPSKGYIKFFEKSKACFDKVGIVYDQLPLFSMLRVFEIIKYFTTIRKLEFENIKKKYFEIFEINKIQKSFIKELSQGEKKRVGILLALIHNPDLLILDEPFANLDPTITERLWKIIRNENRTIFFTTHNWKEAEKLAVKIAFIYKGKVLFEPQSPQSILNSLPALKIINFPKNENIIKLLTNYQYYLHDENINVFFNEDSKLLKDISQFTNNFSVQEVDLKDAYLFNINNYKA